MVPHIKGVSVKGKYKNLTKRQTKRLCGFFGEAFLGPRIWRNTHLEVQYMNIREYGLCSPTDYDSRYPRDFEILLSNDVTEDEQIGTIIHELVHLKQYAKGEFWCYHRGGYRWLGKKYHFDDDDYLKMPWEIEARLYEELLLPFGQRLVKT